MYEKNCDDNYQSVPFIDVTHSQQKARLGEELCLFH